MTRVIPEETVAEGLVQMKMSTLESIQSGDLHDQEVLTVARVAALQAAQRAWDLIPSSQISRFEDLQVQFQFRENPPELHITVRITSQTGGKREMEALTAVSAAALTIYDLARSGDPNLVISGIQLQRRLGKVRSA